jgi:hypothetical protein
MGAAGRPARAATATCLDAGSAVAVGTTAAVVVFLFSRPPSCVFAGPVSALCWALPALRAGLLQEKSIRLSPLLISKPSLVQEPVETHSWSCARKGAAARPNTGNVKAGSAPVPCVYPYRIIWQEEPSTHSCISIAAPYVQSGFPGQQF